MPKYDRISTMAKRALITGITGQDGSYLTELLHEKGYEVFGLIRGQNNPKRRAIEEKYPYLKLIEGDITDSSSLINMLKISKPDEIYNLAAISFVAYSFLAPDITAEVDGVGVIRLLEAIRTMEMEKSVRFYQASTSELYGKVRESPQNEGTPFHPRSPYGSAKALAHYTTVNYRESYGMHASCGILFNHESPRRGYEFVTRKITSTAAKIKLGKADKLILGNIDSKRDWGFSKDYVEGMWLMLQQDKPDDYVFATGKEHSVRDFIQAAFTAVGLPDWEKYVEYDHDQHLRPADVDTLIGDASKAKKILGWKPSISFDQLVKMMVEEDLHLESLGN